MDFESEDDDEFFVDHLDSLNEETLVELTTNNTVHDDTGKQRRKKFIPNYDVPGVYKVTLNELTQTSLGLEVGIDVTGENSWKNIKKELLYDNIQVLGDDSEFTSLRAKLESYEEDDVLFGYIPNEGVESDEYYVCLTADAKKHCEYQTERFMRKQVKKLEKAVLKVPRPWVSLGSETEVDENIPRNSRPLIKVEIKSKYPTVLQPERFYVRNAEEARDGYVKLVPLQTMSFENVVKKRIDAAVQANSQKVDSEAQTIPKFPQNVWTQCSVEADVIINDPDEKVAEEAVETKTDEEEGEKHKVETHHQKKVRNEKRELKQKLVNFIERKISSIQNLVQFNSAIDIYNIDYPDLIRVQSEEGRFKKIELKEFMCFSYFKGKDKVIATAAWHPVWPGLVAIAYADTSTSTVKTAEKQHDEVLQAVYNKNLVIIWSIADNLNPKLYLESVRDVQSLCFCPFEENILIGGCVNGQIVIWDLTGKLDDVNESEIITENQSKYKVGINLQMGWDKKAHDKSVVRRTAMSDLLYDHTATVTDVSWLSPHYEITNTGKLNALTDDKPRSKIFFSISFDGTVLIWNLNISEAVESESFLEMQLQKSTRIGKYPSNLILKTSPYKVLDGKLRPIYKIIIGHPESLKTEALSSISFKRPVIEFVECDSDEPSSKKVLSAQGKSPEEEIPQAIWLASMSGEILKVSWKGLDVDTEEPVNTEYCDFVSRAIVHDGSVVQTARNHFNSDILASVGGKVLAIWSDHLPNKPIIWKKLDYYLTNVAWSRYIASQLWVTTEAGSIDIWDFSHRSDLPIKSQSISGCSLTTIYMHTVPDENCFLAIGDCMGTLRLFKLPESLTRHTKANVSLTIEHFNREVKIKKFYRSWQNNWLVKHHDVIEARDAAKSEEKAKKDDIARSHAKKNKEKKDYQDETLKEEKMRVIGREEKWQRLQWKFAEKTIQEKKRLSKSELLKQEKPLRDLEAQRQAKLKKQSEMFVNRENIFEEAVVILFPEAASKPPKEIVLTPSEEIMKTKKKYLEEYKHIDEEATNFMAGNPYECVFNWEKLVTAGKNRRQENVADATAKHT